MTLHIDFETFSPLDLKKCGVYKTYAHPQAGIHCMAWRIDSRPVRVWTPGQRMHDELFAYIHGGGEVVAHNANFERTIWRQIMAPRYSLPDIPLERWRCTMAQARALALPAGLEDCCAAIGLPIRKDPIGYGVMLKFCKPRKVNDDGTFEWWHDDPAQAEKLDHLYEYCANDVEMECLLDSRLLRLRPEEQKLWQLDQRINDRGVETDPELAERAKVIVDRELKRLNDNMWAVTCGEVEKVTNVARLVKWCKSRGVDTDSLAKDKLKELIEELLEDDHAPLDVIEALMLRQEGNKASAAKIQALINGTDADGRARGLLEFHVASTGRWGGRRFQPQNIKRPERKGEVSGAIDALLTCEPELFEMLYSHPLTTVSDCIRGMIRARPNHKIIARDFANIEGRGLAWLAREEPKLAKFRAFDAGTGPDIYKATASGILGIPVDKINDDQRQAYGKVPELALGYQGGVGAFQSMARVYGVRVTNAEADKIKVDWREIHPATAQFWRDLEENAHAAIENPGKAFHLRNLVFKKAGSFLFIRLPSGRSLAYAFPHLRMKEMPWIDRHTGKKAQKLTMAYWGINSYTRQWERCYAYGGLLAENTTSGVARDCMAASMLNLEAEGFETILSVHDEIVSEVPDDRLDEERYDQALLRMPLWAAGLPIAAGGFVAERYRK